MTDPVASLPVSALVLAAPATPAARRAVAAPLAPEAAALGRGVAVSTCHRVELHIDRAVADGIAGRDPWSMARRLDGEAAARHVISLAVGLESAVLAEDQVLHQLRAGVSAARARGGVAPAVDLLADAALRAGRIARSWRPVRGRSLADLAVGMVAEVLGSSTGRRILVVGAGEMGRLVGRAATDTGARVTIASPTAAHAATLAEQVGACAVPFDPGPAGVRVDGIVIALSGPWRLADATLDVLRDCPVIVDLSMPGALPTVFATSLGSRHVGLDDLALGGDHGTATSATADERYRRRLEELRDRTLADVVNRMTNEPAAIAGALAARIERERRAQLADLWRRHPELSPRDREVIEGMTARLTRRLFRAPLARLGTDGDDGRLRLARELFEL